MREMMTRLAGLALALALSTPALADDPHDPTMRTPEAIARDHEIIRQMNLDMLEQVRARDAAYAKGWREYARVKADPRYGREAYEDRMADYHRDQARYAQDRRRYEQAMARWRRDVAACRAGDRAACE